MLRDKVMLFWTLLFPLVLATFFHLAFSNLTSEEQLKPTEIAVVMMEKNSYNTSFIDVLELLSKKGEGQLFITRQVSSTSQAKQLLEDNKITGYYVLTDTIQVVVKVNGLAQTIMKSVADQFDRQATMVEQVMMVHPESLATSIEQVVLKSQNHLVHQNKDHTDYTVMFFYTLIGMVCVYTGFFGISAIQVTEANQSTKGARMAISPTNHMNVLLASLLAGCCVQYVEILILLAYIVLILGVSFGSQLLPILLLTFVGCFAGMALGIFVGACNRKGENTKVGILLAVAMTCSFFAGMMALDVKLIIAEYVPILEYFNPVTMVTNALYALYYYPTLDRYFVNVLGLVMFTGVFMTLSYYFIRRKQYDSI